MNNNSNRIYLFVILFVVYFFSCAISQNRQLSDEDKLRIIQGMYQSYKSKSFPGIPDISVEELIKIKREKKVILVDVRDPEEWKISMIPGAITKETFLDDLQHYKEYVIIPYCTIGYRSGLYTKELSDKKLNSVNLRGGVLAWAHAKQIFTSTDGDSQKVHVYSERWNLLPKGYKAIW